MPIDLHDIENNPRKVVEEFNDLEAQVQRQAAVDINDIDLSAIESDIDDNSALIQTLNAEIDGKADQSAIDVALATVVGNTSSINTLTTAVAGNAASVLTKLNAVVLSQAQYNALTSRSSTTLYIISDAS